MTNEIIFSSKCGNNMVILRDFEKKFSEEPMLSCILIIDVEGFKKRQIISFELCELEFFLNHLRLFIKNEFKIIFMKQIDSIFEFKLARDKSNIITLEGVINSYPKKTSLNFEFSLDEFTINSIQDEIINIICQFK